MAVGLVSVIVPCYNEQESVPLFYSALADVAKGLDVDGYRFEFIFVDDGSTDQTLHTIKKLRETDGRVQYISFSRNFGKESAIYAGLKKSRGDFVVLMDVDMQDPPALLPEMLRLIASGTCDSVATRRVSRKGEPAIRSLFARLFYKLMNGISKNDFVDGARDYKMMTRPMINAILSMGEKNRFTKGIFSWIGFRTHWLEYENIERAAGETKWSFWRLFIYSLEGITAFSTVPLTLSAFAGTLFCGMAFLTMLVVFIRAMIWGDPVGGWPSLVCIILFIGGTELFCIGILGQYLAKTYIESKDRPVYIAREESVSEPPA